MIDGPDWLKMDFDNDNKVEFIKPFLQSMIMRLYL